MQTRMEGLNAAEIGALAHQLMSSISARGLSFAPVTPRPRLRRRRRVDEVTYRVRIDLVGAKPPIWRRLELSSQLFLDEVHQVIQAALGWTDSHLHRFAIGPSVWDQNAELFLCPFDVEEGEDDGVPEADVRLDEVLGEAGDTLRYVYDYGDDWEHVMVLEAVLDRPVDAARAVCTGGRRAGPPEDCGGVWGYRELLDTGAVDAEEFNVNDVNATLTAPMAFAETAAGASGPAAALLQQLTGHPIAYELAELIRAARLDEPVQIDLAEATRMVRRHAWLLQRVGEGGITLTSAGYLPPVDVAAAMVELEMEAEWIGKGNREIQTLPVLELRESAQKLGLLRKSKGRLLLTRPAKNLLDDPLALWWHIAGRLPLHRGDSMEHPAAVVSLLAVGAGRDISTDDYRLFLNGVLGSLGWRMGTGAPLGAWSGVGAAGETLHLLGHLGAFAPSQRLWNEGEPVPGGSALARAVLGANPVPRTELVE